MRDGHCPKCGASAIYRSGDFAWGNRANGVQISATPFPRYAWMDIYICVNCGYSESYVADAEQRTYIADHWTPVPAVKADAEGHAQVPGAATPGEQARIAPDPGDHDTQRLPWLDDGRRTTDDGR